MTAILDFLAERFGIISLLVGIVFVVLALIMYKYPPKKINIFYGYRTVASMQNQETWDFAQKHSTTKMLQLGIFMLALSLLNLFFDISQEVATIIGFVAMLFGIFIMIFLTEQAIKRKFPKE